MEKSRYVVEYLAEGGSDVESMFVEAFDKDEATNIVIEKCGAFSTVLSAQLTKTCGGPGTTQTAVTVPVVDNDGAAEVATAIEVLKQAKPAVVKAPKVKKEKEIKDEKPPSKAAQIRVKTAEVKAVNGAVGVVIAWAVETLGMTKGTATAYLKVIWAETP